MTISINGPMGRYILGLDGDDQIFTGNGLVTVDGGSGGDTVILRTGNTGTVTGGTENDSFVGGNIGSMVLFGNQGATPSPSSRACHRRLSAETIPMTARTFF